MKATPSNDYHARIFSGWQDSVGVIKHQKFRKHLFVDKLGWRLEHDSGIEADEFDTAEAVYFLLYFRQTPVGCWRAIRTTSDYLGRNVFPELATDRPYPTAANIWEISRLGVLPVKAGLVPARLVYAAMVHFAITREAHSLVGVVEDLHARNMGVAGMKIDQFGPSQIVGKSTSGEDMSVFFAEMLLKDQGGIRFERLLRFIDWLEIDDEAYLLGRKSISA